MEQWIHAEHKFFYIKKNLNLNISLVPFEVKGQEPQHAKCLGVPSETLFPSPWW